MRIFARRYSFGRIVEKDEGMGLGVFDSAGVEGVINGEKAFITNAGTDISIFTLLLTVSSSADAEKI